MKWGLGLDWGFRTLFRERRDFRFERGSEAWKFRTDQGAVDVSSQHGKP